MVKSPNTVVLNKGEKEVIGRIEEMLPGTLFRVTVEETGEKMLAYLSGKMRMNRIRVLLGDRVELVIPQHTGKARIIKRL